MQHEVKEKQDLLDSNGIITEPGWARSPLWIYDRSAVRASWIRIKEWDYYYVLSHDKKIGLSVTVSDLGYIGLMAICFLDFETGFSVQDDSLVLLPKGKIGLPPNSGDSIVEFKNSKLSISITTAGNTRRLQLAAESMVLPDGTGLNADVTLRRAEEDESINIATVWKERPTAFYLNEKIACMGASGTITAGNKTYTLDPSTDLGGLDWGRGRWTYRNRWYWGSTSAIVDGVPFGFNLGYGFSDRAPASENVIFHGHRIHKLEEVEFIIDTDDYMKPWKVTSSDGRCKLDFTPALDRHSETKVLMIKSLQHQVFGYFNGFVVLDDGTRVEVKDLLGFAEDVFNQW